MKKLLFILALIALFFASCSPQKRLNNLVKKHPKLIQTDTIHFIDSVEVITKRVETDTMLLLNSISKDTLIITQENLKIKTFYNYQTDSIYIFGECDTIVKTAYIERDIPVEKYTVVESGKNRFLWGIIVALGVVILFCFAALTFRGHGKG